MRRGRGGWRAEGEGAAGRPARLKVGESAQPIGLTPCAPRNTAMNDPLYSRLRLRADAKWRTVVRAAACQFDPGIRYDPTLRFARKRFYRSMLTEHRADRRELANAFRL